MSCLSGIVYDTVLQCDPASKHNPIEMFIHFLPDIPEFLLKTFITKLSTMDVSSLGRLNHPILRPIRDPDHIHPFETFPAYPQC